MSRYQPVLATLGYVLSPDRERVLLLHRNTRPGDIHEGKYVGLGGKLEPREDVVVCMTREIREEAGIEATELSLRGTVSWPGFGKDGEDWFAFVFLITAFEGQPRATTPEGTLVWKPVEELLSGTLPVWKGDPWFLQLLFRDPPAGQWHAVMPYRNGEPQSFSYSVVATASSSRR